MYIDNLVDIGNEYKNTYHSRIKMKPVDVKSSAYIGFNVVNDNNYSKFELGDLVRISK